MVIAGDGGEWLEMAVDSQELVGIDWKAYRLLEHKRAGLWIMDLKDRAETEGTGGVDT